MNLVVKLSLVHRRKLAVKLVMLESNCQLEPVTAAAMSVRSCVEDVFFGLCCAVTSDSCYVSTV